MKIHDLVELFFGKRHAISLLGVVLFATMIVLSVNNTLPAIGNEWTYCLDDPYIHLSMARNLAEHGNWGISPNEISSASSSPLWVIILALVYPISSDVTTPFVLNILFSIGLIFYADKILFNYGITLYIRLVAIIFIIIATPLVNLCWSGMEHTLHALLSLVFVHTTGIIVSNQTAKTRLGKMVSVRYLLTAFLLGAVRPEGMIVIAIVSMVLIIRHRAWLGVWVCIVGALPIILFGIWSLANDQLFLPNSVLVKSLDTGTSLPSNSGMLSLLMVIVLKLKRAVQLLRSHQILVWCLQILSFCSVFLLLRLGRIHTSFLSFLRSASTPSIVFLLITLIALVLHLLVSDAGWFYRYEAYLIPLTIISCTLVLHQLYNIYFNQHSSSDVSADDDQAKSMTAKNVMTSSFIRNAILIVLCIAVNFPLFSRSSSAWSSINNYAKLIWQMQRQTARFVEMYYSNKSIALTDIGAPSYYTTARITDFYGLGNATVAKLKWKKSWNKTACENLIKEQNIDCAITYSALLGSIIPDSWTEVGRLTVADDISVQEPTINFYATSSSSIPKVTSQILDFARRVPSGVHISITLDRGNYFSSTSDSSTINR